MSKAWLVFLAGLFYSWEFRGLFVMTLIVLISEALIEVQIKENKQRRKREKEIAKLREV